MANGHREVEKTRSFLREKRRQRAKYGPRGSRAAMAKRAEVNKGYRRSAKRPPIRIIDKTQ
ncbi:MAG: hypothetical protein HY982_00090 [Candidatus Magasanikbacteria bacterium]|nr:hypothetical protein [Candidatus Magasanikbacteria bacterium]